MRHQDKENGPQECGPFFIVFSDEEATTQWWLFSVTADQLKVRLSANP
ncbi:hypothetical protein ACHFCA_36215 (plasmid) [Delftia tsuruhatensis]